MIWVKSDVQQRYNALVIEFGQKKTALLVHSFTCICSYHFTRGL